MRVLVTGSEGFIAKNLIARLREQGKFEVLAYGKRTEPRSLEAMVANADAVVHLAGVNRPQDPAEFEKGNRDVTTNLAALVRETNRRIPLIFASSVQAERENPYGRSKREAENALLAMAAETGSPVYIYRLPNVFGKWCRPNYNSAVATFCHSIARDLAITVHDASAALSLVYIDDVTDELVLVLRHHSENAAADLLGPFREVTPVYTSTVGEVAAMIRSFKESRTSLTTSRVGSGLLRALYSTYLSYLPPDSFAYSIPKHVDQRGEFAEVLKTPDCGQFSYFTALPGVTRGGHYHHSKTEKFLIIRGIAKFRFRHILTGETAELRTSGDRPQIVETAPGWSHDITNIGETEMIVMLWANETFDRDRPDTFACEF